MSQENVEVIERMLASFHTGNTEEALASFSVAVVLDASRRPGGEVVHGRSGVSRMIGDWLAAWTEWSEKIHEIRDLGDRVLVFATQRGRGKGSGVEVVADYMTLYDLRDGEIIAMTLFVDTDEALEAAGLSE